MTTLVRYSPWSVSSDDIGQLFGQLFAEKGLFSKDLSNMATSECSPRVDIKEEADKFIFIADLPGVDPKEIAISIENNTLSIKGERKIERKSEEQNYFRIERFSGTFDRRFSLPDQVDPTQIQANLDQGVLEIIVPKKEHHIPKKIEVQVHEKEKS